MELKNCKHIKECTSVALHTCNTFCAHAAFMWILKKHVWIMCKKIIIQFFMKKDKNLKLSII